MNTKIEDDREHYTHTHTLRALSFGHNRKRLVLSFFAALALVLLSGIVYPPPASADQSLGDGVHAYSIAYGGAGLTGIKGEWHNNRMELSASNFANTGHVNAEMWLLYANHGWTEEGLYNGYDAQGENPCGCLAYQYFWGDAGSGTSTIYFHWIGNTSPNGTNHTYQISNISGTTQWAVYLDGKKVGTSTVPQSSSSSITENGLEYNEGTKATKPVSSSGVVDTFTQTMQGQKSGRWSLLAWALPATIDHGCPTNPIGSCLNGISYGTGNWNFNKPAHRIWECR